MHRLQVSRGQVSGPAAGMFGRQYVAQARIGEGAAQHDVMVHPPRTEGVEVRRRNAAGFEELSGGGVGVEGAHRRDVIRGDRVSEYCQCAGVFYRCGRSGFRWEVLEEVVEPHQR